MSAQHSVPWNGFGDARSLERVLFHGSLEGLGMVAAIGGEREARSILDARTGA